MPDRKTINVPKFNSYNSKPTSKSQSRRPGRSGSDTHVKSQLKEFGKKESQIGHCNHSSDSHLFISEASDLSKISQNEEITNLFVIDIKGDENNLHYGSLHKYSVPKYYRYGAGQVLGAQPTLRINRDLGDENWIVLSDLRSSKKLKRQKNIFSGIKNKKPRIIKVPSNVITRDQAHNELNFIALRSGRSIQETGDEKKVSGINDVESLESKFSTILGKNPNDYETDDESVNESSGSDHEQYINEDNSALEKNAVLSRQVEKFPSDTEAWLSFINHQDLLVRKGDDHRRITQAMVKSIADIKINLYEKALNHSESLENRERLLVGLMSEGEKIWELRTQASRWEQISRNNIDSLFLWTKYIDFKQFTLSIFRYEEVKTVYLQRLKYLSQAAKNEQENAENNYLELIQVLLRSTLFIRDAGYTELAIAIWQINLEINFCASGVDLERDDGVNLIKEFWESEVPRIGEEGARGFRHYIDNQDTTGVMDPSVDKPQEYLDKKNIFESWAAAERLRSKSSRIPAKTLDDVVEDDPFRVILFADIQDFLCVLPPESKKLHRSCINAFLLFCRLPPLVNLDDQNEIFDDTLINDGLVRSELDWLENDCSGNREQSCEYGTKNFCLAPIPNFVPSPESLFYDITEFQGKPRPFRNRFPEDSGPVKYSYIRSSLELLTRNWSDDSLAEYYLSFENTNEPGMIKKTSKALLKQKPSSLRLYNAYALIEWSRGNKEIAEGVFSAALSMGKDLTSNETDHEILILLWKCWIWICLESKDSVTALKYLICIVDGIPDTSFNISSTLILRTKQHLTSKRDFLISRNSVFGVIYSECLAIFEYLSFSHGQDILLETQRDIVSAMNIYNSTSSLLDGRKQEISHELLLQSAARLVFYHCQCGPYRPAQVREYLTGFLQKFPKNSVLLSLYSWNESRLRIDNRVRHILLNTVLISQNDCLTSRLFAIRYEIRAGTIYSVKAAFEHSVSSPVTRNSAGLWQLYILYCLQVPQLHTEVKSVWYRALRNCPSVKELYIFGFEKLGKILDFSELKRTWRIMEEKELRVHVNLEDEFDDCESLKR
ncbi:Protein NRDE2-like protein [Golovinomyces cichoracearum]|uniref:Protein NRDE2-like protein n=1 Tax=Golovinomyces cichoracearum TaxID=62708 RepID=A0A420IDB3_9PEZI|nr:Protein NRDE2-like protein [Golovinomyces cichoracearum]